MDKRPVLRSSHTRQGESKDDQRKMVIARSACPWSVGLLRGSTSAKLAKPKINRLVPGQQSRPKKRASAKNIQDIARNEVLRTHTHMRIDNFDQVVAVYCGLIFNAFGDRRLVGLYVKSCLRAQSREVEKENDAVFTLESAKEFAKAVYARIALEILEIVENGELQISERGVAYRRGYISVNGSKRHLVICMRRNAAGESCAAQVMTEQRFDRRVLSFAQEPGRDRGKKHSREKPLYVNASHTAM